MVLLFGAGYYTGHKSATTSHKAAQADLKDTQKDEQTKEDKRQGGIASEFVEGKVRRDERASEVIKYIYRDLHVPIELACDVPVPASLLRNLNELRGYPPEETSGEPSGPVLPAP